MKNKKYEQILREALSLFNKYGIRRIPVEEICQVANVSKMTFYKYFANKNELVKTLYNRLATDGMEKYHKIMNQPISFPEKIKLMIQLKLMQFEELSEEFIQDLLRFDHPEVQALLLLKKKEIFQQVLQDFAGAQKRGEIRSDIKIEFILYMLDKIYDMYQDEKLLKLYPTQKEMVSELINYFFYGILSKK
ncbi:TetR/AcrR family transcriptional regulator [candidate division KSB1 bacterium]|nr:TetR/AcrR family transcriptional regulator [candidate division KSB1 bacterium]